jgi:DNA-binding NtrC family response regulator
VYGIQGSRIRGMEPRSLPSVLVLDDEEALAQMIATALGDAGYEVTVAGTVAAAQAVLNNRDFAIALLDMHLPDGTGTDVLRRLIADGSLTEVIVLTGNRDIASAIEVMKLGASDYLIKPTPLGELEIAVEKARDRHRLRVENQALRLRLGRHESNTAIVTEDPEFRKVIDSLAQVGPSDLPVLIQGENGCGKEMMARAVHDASHHRMEPFVAINCAAAPDQLELDLFGCERGALPGVSERKPGLFELADRGSLFLDEIDAVRPALQPRLLRALETREYSRIGSERLIRVHARVIAGTHRDLSAMVTAGEFRQDLHYLLNGVTLRIPALRERPDDVLPLSLHFLRIHGIRRGLSPRALEAMKAYSWPGNVRELQMVIRRAGVLATGATIEPRDLPFGKTMPS